MQKTVYTEVDVDIDLSDFDDQELLDELESRNLSENSKFDFVDHLIVCGQLDEAKAEALRIVEEIIGRPFK